MRLTENNKARETTMTADYPYRERQVRRSQRHSSQPTATRLDTPNADSTETTRIQSNPKMNFQTYTQSEPNQYQNSRTQSRRVGR